MTRHASGITQPFNYALILVHVDVPIFAPREHQTPITKVQGYFLHRAGHPYVGALRTQIPRHGQNNLRSQPKDSETMTNKIY